MLQLARTAVDALFDFTFYYPLFMSYLWMAGALYYYFHYERRNFVRHRAGPPELPEYPLVSILVPCHNEEQDVEEVAEHLLRTRYPRFEIVAINDGSTDGTGAVLDRLAAEHAHLRVVHLAANQGKALALNTAALLARGEYLVCIDGDALLDEDAVAWLMTHFFSGPRVGAVTGNPRVRSRSTLLGRLQTGEFSSIIGLIKRAQRTYGRIFTVSGVVACFRKAALQDVGYWSTDMLTEDVDVSWKLQLNHWDVRFEPRALCWILMPETLKGLWRQRLRWATGGMQVLLKEGRIMRNWRKRRMWPVFVEYLTSVLWAYLMLGVFALWLAGKVLPLPAGVSVPTLVPQWTGVVIGTTCLLQIGVSLYLDSRYDRGLGRQYYWMIWYPLAYWTLNVFTTVVAVPRALLWRRGTRATWRSPDRGVRP
ncbi:MAG: poly-beta-1,6 N-acetyl-D-glucosamine synthase [Burkholderiales bacterium]|nr:poly-beta-1,6 N-acetyl-D-glucosamine synthase [Burkholderiales bacterium]